MINQKKYFQVGLFIAGGLALGFAAILWVGMAGLSRTGRYCATYFDESVQGLQIDSPVKYRGVTIGRVDHIGVAPDARLIEVVVMIDTPLNLTKGFVAQLKAVGITGSMFIELDRVAEDSKQLSPHLDFTSQYPVIASTPSEISELFRSLDDIIRNIQGFDLPGISDRMKTALDEIRAIVEEVDAPAVAMELRQTIATFDRQLADQPWNKIIQAIERSSASFDATMADGRKSLANIDRVANRLDNTVTANEPDLREAIVKLREAAQETRAAMTSLAALLANTDRGIANLSADLAQASRNLAQATGNLNQGMETLAEDPGRLLFSEPAPSREAATGSDNPRELTE